MRDFWENCDTDFAHITVGKYQSYDEMVEMWHEEYLDEYDFDGKTVIDYGCGGGWLYDELPGTVQMYHGFDIAARQIEAAGSRISDNCAKPYFVQFHLLPHAIDNLKADVLICQSVIQHLSVEEYKSFLQAVNTSGIPELILNWRDGECVFNKDSVQRACITNCDALLGELTNYELVKLCDARAYDMRYATFRKKGHN